jgi:hypothetical protein
MRRTVRAAIEFSKSASIPVYIISGYRTKEEQDELRDSGRPTAPDELSTHRTCPATGIDISLGPIRPSEEMVFLWGWNVRMQGLRWGGGSPLDERGSPIDWEHVDMGPRNDSWSISQGT